MKKLLVALCAAACALWADQITLKNGDRITGDIVRSDTKALVIKTEYAGEVTVAWDAITTIDSTNPLYVNLEGGNVVAGIVEAEADEVRVVTETAGTITASREAVEGIRNEGEQQLFEAEIDRLRNPRLIDLWTGLLDFGYASARGNAKTQTLTLSTRADRVTTRDKISVYYTSVFASNDTTGIRTTTANAKRGGITYDVNFDRKWFSWGSVELEADEFQTLDLRFVPAGGLGHHTINTEATKLDFRFGAAGNREFFFDGLKRNSAEIIVGEDFTHNFSETTSIQQRVRFFPNMTDTGAYRLNFDTTFATAFARWMSLQFTFSDRYLSNPAPGRLQNDVLFSAGIRLTFAQN